MVTTSNHQDGDSSSSPPNPSQPEQQPPAADNSNLVSQPIPAAQATEVPSPLRDGAPSSSPSNPSSQPEQQPVEGDNLNQDGHSPPTDPAAEAAPPLTHPAPLPESPPVTNSDPSWKRPPPKIAIKIYSVPVGVVVSWHARITPKHEEIKKFELYSYQEGSHLPSASLWKKLSDIDPLPLPMACTLSQFSGGHTYHFAIRAADIHGRCGKFSECVSIFMEEDRVADELRLKAVKVEDDDDMESEEYSNDEEMMESDLVKEEEECSGSEGRDLEDKSAGLPSDSVTPVKEVEKTVGCVKESEMAVEHSTEEDVSQGKEQEKAKAQAKEQDKETVQVKEEKERSPCSC